MGKKIAGLQSGVYIPEVPSFAPDVFANLSFTQQNDYAHGWQGGPQLADQPFQEDGKTIEQE